MSDYWIEQLIHPHIHSHISTYPNTQASIWMHTYTSQFLLSSIPLYVQDQWENRTVWQIVIQFTIENATWRFKCASFDSSARIMSERDAFDQIEFFFIRFIYIKYFIYCHVWHTITSTIPSHTRLNIQYICNTSVVFRRCLCRSCSTLPYFEHIFTWMAPISIANECFCSVFNVRPSLTPTILSFRFFNYTVTYICGYSAQYIEFVSRSTLKLPEIKIIFSNSLTHSTFFIESIKNNKQRESCVYCVFCQNMRAFDNFHWLSLYKQWTPTWMISISSVCFRFFFVLISLFLLLLLLLSLFSVIVVLVHVVVVIIVVCEVSSCRDR